MKKSPFSTPRGNGNGNRQGFGWNSNERRNSRGYKQRNDSFEIYPSNSSQDVSSDYIPFSSPSPSYYDRGRDKNFHGRGGRNRSFSGSPGYHSNDNSPRGKFNSYSPHNSRGRNRNFSKTSHRDIPISKYINLRDILEDPWERLLDNANKSMNQSTQEEGNESVVSINAELFNESVEMKSTVGDEESEDLISGEEKFKDSND